MASRLYHSFITTLLYIWSVIKAFLSLRSPPPFPFRQTSIIISYPTPIDLEQGLCSPDFDPASRTPPPPRELSSSRIPCPSRKPVQFTSADIHMQGTLVYMPAFSVDSSGQGRTKNDLRDYDGGRYLQQSASRPDIAYNHNPSPTASTPGGPPSGPRYMSVISNKSPFNYPHMVRQDSRKKLPPNGDPFRDLPPNPPLPSIYNTENPPAQADQALVRGPFVTPTRHRKGGRGHRRAPFAAITNLPNAVVPETPTDRPVLMPGPSYPSVYPDHPPVHTLHPIRFEDSPYPSPYPSLEDTPSPLVLDQPVLPLVQSPSPLSLPATDSPSPSSTPSPALHPSVADPESPCPSILDTPVPQHRRCSLSLRRRPAYEDLHSPSPTRPSPKKRSISRLWFYPTEPKSPTVGPLRIVKRSGSSSPPTSSSPSHDDMADVVLKVRAVFELLREDEDEDEGAAARELLNRESVETAQSTGEQQRQRQQEVEEEEEEEESDEEDEYGNEVTVRTISSPPPPYALSPGLSPSDLYANLKRDSPLDAFKYIKEDRSLPATITTTTTTTDLDHPHGLRRQNSTVKPSRHENKTNKINDNNDTSSPKKLHPPSQSPSAETLTPTISTELAYFKDHPTTDGLLLAPTSSSTLSLSTAVSTELSYLKGGYDDDEQHVPPPPVVIIDSVDSAMEMDDILASFEDLITSMGITIQGTPPPAPAPASAPGLGPGQDLPSPRLEIPTTIASSVSLRSIKRVQAKTKTKTKTRQRPETGCYAYGGLAEECDAQWCDLLELDNYDSD